MFIDTHAHLSFREYKGEIPKVIIRALDKDVKAIINIGSNHSTSQESIRIARLYDANTRIDANDANKKSAKGVIASHTGAWQSRDPSASLRFAQDDKIKLYAVVGCHPIHLTSDITETAIFDGKEYKFTTKKEEFDVNKYQKLIDSSDMVVGVGETGLDFFRLDKKNNFQFPISNFQKIQKKVFKEHIKLAKKNNLPLVLHCRGTKDDPYAVYDEMLNVLKDTTPEVKSLDTSGVVSNKGVIHCYGGNLKQAREFIKLGFYIGINGIVTFRNARELQSIVKEIPLDKILLETDCPFLAPDPYRGKRNEPMYIPIIAQKIAELKNINISEVEKQTTENAIELFNI